MCFSLPTKSKAASTVRERFLPANISTLSRTLLLPQNPWAEGYLLPLSPDVRKSWTLPAQGDSAAHSREIQFPALLLWQCWISSIRKTCLIVRRSWERNSSCGHESGRIVGL